MGNAGGLFAWRKLRDPRGPVLPSALVLVVGVLAGTVGVAAGAPGAGTTDITADLTYNCQFPSRSDALAVTVAATFPASVAPGQRVQPTGVHITSGLPRSAVAYLTRLGATSVSASGVFATIETAQGKSVTAQWPARAPAGVPLSANRGLKLTETATPPPTTASSPGTITFTAGDLVLDLKPKKADGTATTPATVRVACALGKGVNGTLAAITVASANPSASPSGSPSGPARSARQSIKGLPQGCGKIKVIGTGVATCGYITGYQNVTKLFGAALLQPKRPARPGLVNLDFAESHKFKPGKLIVYSTAKLYYKGRAELPPVTATFLAFRFVPVTATLHLVELTPIKIVSVSGITGLPFPITVRTSTKISVRITDVKVNGVPLDVGTHCRTASPVKLDLIGKGQNTIPPKGYTVPTGGPLAGRVTIPRFTGCGVSENLDPLLTGSISGPGNFLKVTQGKLCGPSQPANWTCPPPVPKPLR